MECHVKGFVASAQLPEFLVTAAGSNNVDTGTWTAHPHCASMQAKTAALTFMAKMGHESSMKYALLKLQDHRALQPFLQRMESLGVATVTASWTDYSALRASWKSLSPYPGGCPCNATACSPLQDGHWLPELPTTPLKMFFPFPKVGWFGCVSWLLVAWSDGFFTEWRSVWMSRKLLFFFGKGRKIGRWFRGPNFLNRAICSE